MKKMQYKQVFLVVAVTAIAGEIFIYPLGQAFQLSIASAVFMYAILSLPNLLIIPTGSLSALSIFALGVFLDYLFRYPGLPLEAVLSDRLPGILYFVLLAILLKAGGVKRYAGLPFSLRLAGFMTLADLFAKLAEILFRGELLMVVDEPAVLASLVMGSLIQVFLVFSFINISQFKQIRVLDEQARLRFEKKLIITSNLYDEFFFMHKSTENMERIMAESYKLYKMLKNRPEEDKELEALALKIAEEVHEVKKDTSRILAGLSKVLNFRKEIREMYLSEIFELIVKANRNYSQKIDKQIQFNVETVEDMTVQKIHPLLAIMNNIVENAVEAIPEKGTISIQAKIIEENLQVIISDDGREIGPKDAALIFEPGFTTKFNDKGIPSTGIGLAYVKGLVEDLGGQVALIPSPKKKSFILTFPREEIGG